MSMEQSSDEIRRSTIVSRSPGLAYERMRDVRRTHFSRPLAEKLRVEGALLVAVAAALSLAIGVGGATDGAAAVGLVTLAAGTAALVAAGATAHAAAGTYRLYSEPLTEHQALAVITVEDAASYLGIATGGLLAGVTVLASLATVAGDVGPTAGQAVTTGAVMGATAVAAAFALTAGRYLDGRLPRRE
jgi:hypothetical protein